jgi:hypothetical protein
VLVIVMAGMLVFGCGPPFATATAPTPVSACDRSSPLWRQAPVIILGALAVATLRTVQLSDRLDAATDVVSDWAADIGERLVDTRFDGTTLVLLVDGMTAGTQDEALPELLEGPSRTAPRWS